MVIGLELQMGFCWKWLQNVPHEHHLNSKGLLGSEAFLALHFWPPNCWWRGGILHRMPFSALFLWLLWPRCKTLCLQQWGVMYKRLQRATWKSSYAGSVNKRFVTWLHFLPAFSMYTRDQTSKRLLLHHEERALTGHPLRCAYVPQIFKHIHLLTKNKIFQRRWIPKSLPFFTMKI